MRPLAPTTAAACLLALLLPRPLIGPQVMKAAVGNALCGVPGESHDAERRRGRSLHRPKAHPVRLRFEWSGPQPAPWNALLEVGHGRFENPVSLAVEADDPGTVWTRDGAVWLRCRSPHAYAGFDVTVVAPPAAILTLTLQSPGRPGSHEQFRFRLSDLSAGAVQAPTTGSEVRLAARRVPGDSLAVGIDRPHLVFAPGERLAGTVRADLPARTASDAHGAVLNWQLTPARSERLLNRGSLAVALAPSADRRVRIPVAVRLPNEEGVYDVRLSLSGPNVPERKSVVQVVVVAGEKPFQNRRAREPRPPESEANTPPAPDKLVDSFRPSDAETSRRVESRDRWRLFRRPWDRLLDLLPQFREPADPPAEDGIAWTAYRLRIEAPGRAHRLVVTLPPAAEGSLGASILEPNAARQLMPVGRDTGIHVEPPSGTIGAAAESNGSPAAQKREPADPVRHEVLFWPRVDRPVLLIHDLGTGRPVEVERIDVHECELSVRNASNQRRAIRKTQRQREEPPAPEPLAALLGSAGHSSLPLSALRSLQASGRRLVGPYMHKPLLPENFGGTEVLDSEGRRSLDDWVTFDTAARRLCDYLHFAGYNSLMLAVLADGSTIYPSRLLQPTPRYDTGIYLSTGQDPVRKDVLELVLRLFDREGLALIPELQFSTPLPALERVLVHGGGDATGIELIGRDGRTWRDARGAVRGRAPYYNPLDPRVQEAVLDVVRELVERYRAHESLEAVAVELSSDGYLQFPGVEWGYDERTVSRFEQATGLRVPAAEGPDRARVRYEFLTKTAREQWVRWRCEELARFHARLAKVVTEARPSLRFVLSGNHVLRGSRPDDELLDAIKSGGRLAALLPPKGLDFSLYANLERTLVLRPSLWRAPERFLPNALDETVNRSESLAGAFSSGGGGHLFVHVPRECRISAFDEISPWQPAYTWLAAHVGVPAAKSRARSAHALASQDAQMIFEGGWMIPLGHERHTRELRDLLRELPAVPFQTVQPPRQPAVVRLAHHGGRTWLYVVNDSPDPVQVSLQLSCGPATTGRQLGRDEPLALAKAARTGSLLALSLRGHEIRACELNDPHVQVLHSEITVPKAALAAMERRILELRDEIARVHEPPAPDEPRLPNGGFEQTATRGELPGWSLAAHNAATWKLDGDNPHSGKSALLLTTVPGSTAGISAPVDLHDCRFLALTVWLRSDKAALRDAKPAGERPGDSREGTPARLAFEATVDGALQTHSAAVHVGSEWRPYIFEVKDIPAAGVADARVRIEVGGPARLWIDDAGVELQRVGPDDLRQLTKAYLAVTLAREQSRHADCQRLLDSYWGRFLFDPGRRRLASPAPPIRSVNRLLDFLRR